MTIITWDNDGLKLTTTIPLGTNPKTGQVYPATTLVGKTLTAFLGVIARDGTVSGSVGAATVTSTEALVTQAQSDAAALLNQDLPAGLLLGAITALWTPAAVLFGMKRVQFVVNIPGDKPYTITDQDVQVLASLG
jgi:Mg/Co/Ni transporter MgtE